MAFGDLSEHAKTIFEMKYRPGGKLDKGELIDDRNHEILPFLNREKEKIFVNSK